MKLNTSAISAIKKLIAAGKIDKESAWSFTAADGDALLGPNGDDWKAYAAVHLGVDTDAPENTKARWTYPVAKGGKVYRRGVIAAESRAAQQGSDDIAKAAKDLLTRIDAAKDEDFLEVHDYADWDWGGDESNRTMQTMPDGSLQGKAVATNVGVFSYLNSDGSIRRELRPPEEVFDPQSTDSLRHCPVTNDHPDGFVTPENYKDLQVGSVGDGVCRDDYNLVVPLAIKDQATISAIKAGKKGLSCGYTRTLRRDAVKYTHPAWDGASGKVVQKVAKTYPCPGVWNGMPYDCIQTNIRYNHLAVVKRGRAGDAARLNTDSADPSEGRQVLMTDQPTEPIAKEPKMKITLDNGLEYDAAPEVAVAYAASSKAAKDSEGALAKLTADTTAEKSRLEGELAAAKDKATRLESELKAAKDAASDPKALDAAVAARVRLVSLAAKAGMKDAEAKAMDSDALMRAIVAHARPGLALDGKDANYVSGVFDSVALDLEKGASKTAVNRSSLSQRPASGARDADDGSAASATMTGDEALRLAQETYHRNLTFRPRA